MQFNSDDPLCCATCMERSNGLLEEELLAAVVMELEAD